MSKSYCSESSVTLSSHGPYCVLRDFSTSSPDTEPFILLSEGYLATEGFCPKFKLSMQPADRLNSCHADEPHLCANSVHRLMLRVKNNLLYVRLGYQTPIEPKMTCLWT